MTQKDIERILLLIKEACIHNSCPKCMFYALCDHPLRITDGEIAKISKAIKEKLETQDNDI